MPLSDEQFLAYIATFKKDDRVIEIGQSGLMGRCGDVYFDDEGRVCVLWDGWHDDDPPGRMGSSVTHGTRLLKDVLAAARACDGMPASLLAGLPSWTPPMTDTGRTLKQHVDEARQQASDRLAYQRLLRGVGSPTPPSPSPVVRPLFQAQNDVLIEGDFASISADPTTGQPVREPQTDPAVRLEYLRGELRAERISYGELHELQSLAAYIHPSDTELLEAAGVPEHEHPAVTALRAVQQALACHRDNQQYRHPVHGALSLEEVKYCVVDPVLDTQDSDVQTAE